MTEAPPKPPSDPSTDRNSNQINWTLTVSLMVNTLLVGLFLGQVPSGGGMGGKGDGDRAAEGPPPRAETRIAEGVLASVPADQRAEIRSVFREAMRDARPQFSDRRQARRELRAAMVADPFDSERLADAFARLRESETAMEQSVQAALVEQFGMLSVEQRQQVVRALEPRGRGERFRRWRDRRNGE
ncbi:MAG: periplasmic heavy metal sensor [Pseudomonadota bacterium]